jgi:hypothetical protein
MNITDEIENKVDNEAHNLMQAFTNNPIEFYRSIAMLSVQVEALQEWHSEHNEPIEHIEDTFNRWEALEENKALQSATQPQGEETGYGFWMTNMYGGDYPTSTFNEVAMRHCWDAAIKAGRASKK